MAKFPKVPKGIPKKGPPKPPAFAPKKFAPKSVPKKFEQANPPVFIPKATHGQPISDFRFPSKEPVQAPPAIPSRLSLDSEFDAPVPRGGAKAKKIPMHPRDFLLSEEEKQAPHHIAKVNKWRSWPLFVMGLTAFGIGVYGVQLYISITEAPEVEGGVPEDLSDRFDKEADGYDEKVNMAETMLFLKGKRKLLLAKAKGHVLESAVGTGRNIPYYPTKKCETVTLLDQSAPMLAVAKRKWKDEQPEYFHRVFFKNQSALDPITPPYDAQDGYDTVIQTMGLCSTAEPEKLLQNLEAATKEDGGQILLLEHGKSHWEWLNKLLDKTAPAHANEHGCWWNKDIGKIVQDSGLEVVAMRRYNFGTTWWIEMKPRKGMRTKQAKSAGVVFQQAPLPLPSGAVAQKPWWNFWG
ncbi:S-adenosyl-L-methionine-dependent methyltransferase [Pleomassaria siparia CBS 279.74]|uniref:S-adenosyl-L-methionine-dependent methyltransferase n=1 Tax=Pleomassaria siparia CBS 279.74 TaxID=1314801 RepID=A0A6G1KIA2_9PLEO|nr:S-adenosyl-L-methionine-dependent methyltransferase [Pleomassaria siparia CBS 279.74]